MGTAYSEGGAEPAKMVRLLLVDGDELAVALDDLVQSGLMSEGDNDCFILTADGSATVERRHARESAEVKRATRTWQSR
jgi:hypothetical protein